MKIIEKQYYDLINNPNIPSNLKKELTDKAQLERWVFVGT